MQNAGTRHAYLQLCFKVLWYEKIIEYTKLVVI